MLCILALVACNKKEEDDDAVTPPAHKDTLSAWLVLPSNAWGPRLDAGSANLSGTPFVLAHKMSDTSEVQCLTILAGSEANGTWDSSACTVPGVGSMADTVGIVPFTTTGGGGTYTNDGTTLTLCRTGSNGCNEHE